MPKNWDWTEAQLPSRTPIVCIILSPGGYFCDEHFMRIGYDLDVDSSHVDRELTIWDVSTKGHLVLITSPCTSEKQNIQMWGVR